MRPAPLALALVLLAPLALAHVPHDRAFVQATEGDRVVEVALNGTAAQVTLLDSADRLRHVVTHGVNPGRMAFDVEERDDASVADRGVLHARVQLDRLLLYRDANSDGAWEPGTDTVLKSWRFVNYRWSSSGVRQVGVGGLTGVDDVLWTGALGGAPNVTLEMVAAGRDVSDEGARARPQDLLLYLTVPSLPPRQVGSLYALEGSLVAPPGASVSQEILDNLTMATHAEKDGKRAYLDWGGQAQVDNREGNVTFALDPPTQAGGSDVYAARWSLPLVDNGLRLVMVSAIEYPLPAARTPDVALPLAAGVLLLAALARRR